MLLQHWLRRVIFSNHIQSVLFQSMFTGALPRQFWWNQRSLWMLLQSGFFWIRCSYHQPAILRLLWLCLSLCKPTLLYGLVCSRVFGGKLVRMGYMLADLRNWLSGQNEKFAAAGNRR